MSYPDSVIKAKCMDCGEVFYHRYVAQACPYCEGNDVVNEGSGVVCHNAAHVDADEKNERDRPRRSEPADFGGGESTGAVDLLNGSANDRVEEGEE